MHHRYGFRLWLFSLRDERARLGTENRRICQFGQIGEAGCLANYAHQSLTTRLSD